MRLGEAAESTKGGWNLWAGLAATCLWSPEGVSRGRQGGCAVRTRCQGLGSEEKEGSSRAMPGQVRSSALPRPSPAPGPGRSPGPVCGLALRRMSLCREPGLRIAPHTLAKALPKPWALPEPWAALP